MKWKNLLKIAFKSILKNGMRSLLTMLGIVIGVGAVIVMVAVGEGSQARITGQIANLGTNLIMIRSGTSMMGGVSRGVGSMNTLTLDDVEALAAEAALLRGVSPEVQVGAQVIGGGNNWNTQITGVSPEYMDIRAWEMEDGAFFTQREMTSRAKVAVLGRDVADALFPDQDPIGQQIRVRNTPFEVIGVLKESAFCWPRASPSHSPISSASARSSIRPWSCWPASSQGRWACSSASIRRARPPLSIRSRRCAMSEPEPIHTKEIAMKLLQGFFLPFFLFFALSLLSGCGKKPLPSVWRDRPVTIDGADTEWEDARIILEQASVGMGLMNDGEYLYLTLSLSDPTLQARIMRQGFIIWFDPRGGKSKIFGVRFPLGMQDMAGQWQERGGPPQGMDRGGMDRGRMGGGMGRGGIPTSEQLQTMYERLAETPEMEILGPAKDQVHRLLIAESDKILLATSYATRRLVYELRVPLAVDYGSTLGIGSAPGKKIGLGIEIPELDMAALRQSMGGRGGGIPDGGMRGGGMDGGMDGGMRGGGMRGGMMPEAFRLWTRIGLASGAGQP